MKKALLGFKATLERFFEPKASQVIKPKEPKNVRKAVVQVTFLDEQVRQYTFVGRAQWFMDSYFIHDAADKAYDFIRDSQTFNMGDGCYRPRTQVKEMKIASVTDHEITDY